MKFWIGLFLGILVSSAYWYMPGENDNSQDISDLSSINNTMSEATAEPDESRKNEVGIEPNASLEPNPVGLPQEEPVYSSELPNSANTTSPGVPIQTSHEHAELMQKSTPRKTVAELHRDLELEEIDSTWAPIMESIISEFVVEHELIEAFSINHVTCRTTLCEIQAFGFEGHSQWNQMMNQMQANDWYRQFNGMSTESTSNNGKATVITILHRSNEEDQSDA
ncbi:MAG: hypothetical protein ACFHXK_00770 [bacterium]